MGPVNKSNHPLQSWPVLGFDQCSTSEKGSNLWTPDMRFRLSCLSYRVGSMIMNPDGADQLLDHILSRWWGHKDISWIVHCAQKRRNITHTRSGYGWGVLFFFHLKVLSGAPELIEAPSVISYILGIIKYIWSEYDYNHNMMWISKISSDQKPFFHVPLSLHRLLD